MLKKYYEKEIYDCLIIGDGPSGLSASIYLKRFGWRIVLVSDKEGGKLTSCGKVDNYLGFFNLTGNQLYEKFKSHIQYLDIKTIYRKIIDFQKNNNYFDIELDNGEIISSKSVLVNSGTEYKKLNIKGEKEFENKGISYCAICDGFFYSGKNVAVIGGGNSSLDSALMLKNICKKVYILNKNNTFKNADIYMLDKLEKSDNVDIIYGALTTSFSGGEEVQKLNYIKNDEMKNLSIEGVFINIGQRPNTSFLKSIKLNEYGEIKSLKNNSTNLKGVFCSGDVKEDNFHQIIIAAGDGAKAAININEYLKNNIYN